MQTADRKAGMALPVTQLSESPTKSHLEAKAVGHIAAAYTLSHAFHPCRRLSSTSFSNEETLLRSNIFQKLKKGKVSGTQR